MGKNHFVIPVFVPHSGCPFQCIFCNQNKITGVERTPSSGEIGTIIDQYLSTIGDRGTQVLVGFYGGSFTAIDESMQQTYLDAAGEYLETGQIHGIRLSTRPDCITPPILLRLRKAGVTHIELGIQSFNDDVLEQSQRGYHSAQAVAASIMIRSYGFLLGHQLMTGLPGDTWQTLKQSVDISLSLKPDTIRIYPTLLIKNTPLADMKHYAPQTLSDALEQAAYMADAFRRHNICILRIGLHPPNDESDIIAGPYHPAMGHKVKEYSWHCFICDILKEYNLKNKQVALYVNKHDADCVYSFRKQDDSHALHTIKIKPVSWLISNSVLIVAENKMLCFVRRKMYTHHV